MAYRQLCALTFAAFGLIAAGCGGGTGSNAAPSASEQPPPSSSDQAPTNSDQTKTTDQAPPSTDAPPSSADAPAGTGGSGRLGELCHQFCDALQHAANDCSKGMLGMQDFCGGDIACQVPPNTPCQNEIADAFSCIIDNIAGICSADKDTAKQNADTCATSLKSFTTCAQAQGATDTTTDPGNPGTGNTDPCATPGLSACGKCLCKAGTDTAAVEACATDACAAP